jgi:hypothetical protein
MHCCRLRSKSQYQDRSSHRLLETGTSGSGYHATAQEDLFPSQVALLQQGTEPSRSSAAVGSRMDAELQIVVLRRHGT